MAASLTGLIHRYAGVFDPPGPRKIHYRPVPRIGGAAVVLSVLAVLGFLVLRAPAWLPQIPGRLALGLVLGVLPVFLISLRDDVRPLGPMPRFLAQLAGGTIAIACGIHLGASIHLFGYTIPLGPFAFPLTLMWMVCITNAFNLIDGLDGLSAGLALIASVSLAALAIVAANMSLLLLSLLLVGALIGFLPFNTYPARVFLGDCGATAVGFWLSCLALPGGFTLPAGMAVLVPLLAVGVPVADTLLSMARRLVRRVEDPGAGGVFDADTEHIHHRLLHAGLDHRRVVLVLYAIGIAAAAVGVLSLLVTAGNAGLLVMTLIAAAFIGVARLGYDEFALIRRGIVLRFYDAPVLQLGFFRVFVDIVLIATAYYLAIVLKYEAWDVQSFRRLGLAALELTLPLTVAAFWTFRMYERSWRFASMDDVVGAGFAVLTSGAASFVLARMTLRPPVRATDFALYTIVLLVLVGAARSSFRIIEAVHERRQTGGLRVAIYGAGLRGMTAVKELQHGELCDVQIVGFIDDDPAKQSRRIGGYPVLGAVATLEAVIDRFKLGGVVLASESLTKENLAAAMAICQRVDVDLLQFSVDVHSLSLSRASERALSAPAASL